MNTVNNIIRLQQLQLLIQRDGAYIVNYEVDGCF